MGPVGGTSTFMGSRSKAWFNCDRCVIVNQFLTAAKDDPKLVICEVSWKWEFDATGDILDTALRQLATRHKQM